MITNAAISAELAKGRVLIYDAITITVARGRVVEFTSGLEGDYTVIVPIEDRIRLTSCPYALTVQAPGGGSPEVYSPMPGVAYSRSRLKQQLGREVAQVGVSFAGTVPVSLALYREGTDSFATTLQELARVGLLDGAFVTIDQVVMPDGAIPADGYVPTPPLRKFAGIVRQAVPSMETVTLSCTDPLIAGGGSVPVGVFTPECRWTFCDGRCPVAMRLHSESPWAIGTHKILDGALVTFPAPGVIRLPLSVYLYLPLAPWGLLVPQNGAMMGMQFQIGAAIDTTETGSAEHIDFQLADTLPWPWDCTQAHLEFQCSKRTDMEDSGNVPPACSLWNTLPPLPGMTSSLQNFGGFPDLPQPEGA